MTDREIIEWAKKNGGTAGWEQKLVNLIQDEMVEKDVTILHLRSLVAYAIGYCSGLGHPCEYLENEFVRMDDHNKKTVTTECFSNKEER